MNILKCLLAGAIACVTGQSIATTISFFEGAEGTLPTFTIGSGWTTLPTCTASLESVGCSFGTFLDSGPNTGLVKGNSFTSNDAFLVEPGTDVHNGETSDIVNLVWQRFDGVVSASLTFRSPEGPFASPSTRDVPGGICNGIQENGQSQEVVFCGSVPNSGAIPPDLHVFVQSAALEVVVPEPISLALLGIGLTGLAFSRRKLD